MEDGPTAGRRPRPGGRFSQGREYSGAADQWQAGDEEGRRGSAPCGPGRLGALDAYACLSDRTLASIPMAILWANVTASC